MTRIALIALALIVLPQPVQATDRPVVIVAQAGGEAAEIAWELIEGSSDAGVIGNYLEQFPESPHAAEARERLMLLEDRGGVILPAPDVPDETELILSLQRELLRVGCYDGALSGKWDAPSREALAGFAENARLRIETDAPTTRALEALELAYDEVCRQQPDATPAGSFWDHNGSLMLLEADGSERTITYFRPRSGMVAAGVGPGTVLFEGERLGDRYTGYAYVFSRRCGPAGYPVQGPVSVNQLRVDLYGQAPRRDESCRIVSYRDDHLVFSYVEDR